MANTKVAEQHMNWCRHFNGTKSERCEKGHIYAEIAPHPKGATGLDGRPWCEFLRLPCLPRFADHADPFPCPDQSFPTAVEVAEYEREVEEQLRRFFADIAANICPHCQQQITRKVQVGRCVYAEPCHHRLYQGTLKGN